MQQIWYPAMTSQLFRPGEVPGGDVGQLFGPAAGPRVRQPGPMIITIKLMIMIIIMIIILMIIMIIIIVTIILMI